MIKQNNFEWNVITNKVEQLPALIEVGTVITVTTGAEQVDEYCPVQWTLSQSPVNGAGHKCLVMCGEDLEKGTMSFEATELGSGTVTYLITDGVDKGKTEKKELEVVKKIF
jgi:hypothetical protein